MDGPGPAPRKNVADYCSSYACVKKPKKLEMKVWGAKAYDACRVMLFKVAMEQQARFPEEAEKMFNLATGMVGAYENKELCAALVAWRKGKTLKEHHKAELHKAKHYADVEDIYQVEGGWIVTPVRNRLHINVWHANGELEKHPWARFLAWFLRTYEKKFDSPMEDLFNGDQLLVRKGYEVQFMLKSEEPQSCYQVVLPVKKPYCYQVVLRVKKAEEQFDMYPSDGSLATSRDAARRLYARVMALEAKKAT